MDTVQRSLTIRQFHIDHAGWGDRCAVDRGRLTLERALPDRLQQNDSRIHAVTANILRPEERSVYTDSIADVIPISTKALGRIGSGITHTLTGIYVVLCGCDVDGNQLTAFGSSHGLLNEQMIYGRSGTPGPEDLMLHVTVRLKTGALEDQDAPSLIHQTGDALVQPIRDVLRELEGREASHVHVFQDRVRPSARRVILIKQVGGQGAIHDNRILPDEPSGYGGGRSNIDLGNVPIILSPNEYRDGALRAMT